MNTDYSNQDTLDLSVALAYAVAYGHYNVAKILIEEGATFSQLDKEGYKRILFIIRLHKIKKMKNC